MDVVNPGWLAPSSVHAFVTTRDGGVSVPPYLSLNLGDHVGDEPQAVQANREILRSALPANPIWMKQVHGTVVSTPAKRASMPSVAIVADAAVTDRPNEVLVVMTADCLPVFFSNRAGNLVGIAHAGWRGLCAGVLENTVTEMLGSSNSPSPDDLIAWMGPAIGPSAFEVGNDVRHAFLEAGIDFPECAFVPIEERPGKYFGNLYELARSRLAFMGLTNISGGEFCTVNDEKRFFSHRRDAISGRFASVIWFTE